MHSLYRSFLCVLFIAPAILLAQLPPSAGADSLGAKTAYDSLGSFLFRIEPSPAASTRGHHAKVGGVVGALVGAAAGVIGSTFIATGCTRGPCHETGTRIGFALWFGSLGAIGGGIVGAALGALVPPEARAEK